MPPSWTDWLVGRWCFGALEGLFSHGSVCSSHLPVFSRHSRAQGHRPDDQTRPDQTTGHAQAQPGPGPRTGPEGRRGGRQGRLRSCPSLTHTFKQQQQQQQHSASASAPSDGWDEAQAEIDALIVQNAAATGTAEPTARATPASAAAEEVKVKVRHCCAKCQCDNPTMMCPLCKTKYCSAACQKAHWPIHKPQCEWMAGHKDNLAEAKAYVKDREGDSSLRLFHAAQLGRYSDCERILNEERPDLNWCFEPGFSANCVYAAAQSGHARVVALLQRHKARADVYSKEGFTPLTSAANHGHEMVVHTLIEHGVDVHLPSRDENEAAALSLAATEGYASIVAILLNAGAVVDRPRSDGATALIMASYGGHVEVVRLLLRAGADPLHRDNMTNTALSAVSHMNHPAIAESLLSAGVPVDLPIGRGGTPLFFAAGAGHVEVVRLLLQAGANPLHSADGGDTPLRLAISGNHTVVVELLQARAAEMGREVGESNKTETARCATS